MSKAQVWNQCEDMPGSGDKYNGKYNGKYDGKNWQKLTTQNRYIMPCPGYMSPVQIMPGPGIDTP